MSVWIYDDVGDSYQQKQYRNLLKLTKNPKMAERGSKMLGLFKFLKEHPFENASELRNAVFFDKGKKTHLFSKTNAEIVQKGLLKKGGAEDEGDGALDHIIIRWMNFVKSLMPTAITETIQPGIDVINMFSLKYLQKIPVLGQFLSMSVEVALQVNKNIAKMLQQYMPIAIGSTPLPFGALVGTVIGYVMSTFFIFLNELMFISRHNFGEAWTQSLAFFPLIGMALQNWAESGDKLMEKFAQKRKKMIEQLNESPMFSWLGWLVESFTIDPNYEGDPEEDARVVKERISNGLAGIGKAAQESVESKPVLGGKRLSTIKNKNYKWRTRRRRFAAH